MEKKDSLHLTIKSINFYNVWCVQQSSVHICGRPVHAILC